MPRPSASSPAVPSNVSELPRGTQLDDGTLVGRAREGDRWAEEALYHRHAPYLMGMVIRLLGNRTEAEDVMQDTFTIALDRLGSLRQPDAVRAWFAQIAVSQVRRRLRRAKLLASLGLRDRTGTVDLESIAASDADAETRSELAAVGRVLALLPTDERLAWMLRHVEGEPLERVARMCRCSLATVKRRIAAAEQHLDRHFGTNEEAR